MVPLLENADQRRSGPISPGMAHLATVAGMVAAPARRRRRALAAALPWTAWALLRTTGTERGFPLVPAMSFTPYAAASALLPLAVAVRAGARSAAVLSAGPGAPLPPAGLGRRRTPGPPAPPGGPRLRVGAGR